MTWVVWRQYRGQAAIAAALLAALAVLLLITGLQMASQWHSALVACTASRSCASLQNTLFLGNHAVGFLVIMTEGVPALFGLFWGAPLVAAELEAHTNQFAWVQSITRRHWLAVKAGWLLLAAAAWGGAVSALVTWWSGPDNALQGDAFEPNRFDIMGIVPVAYALFAMALGIAVGTALRRTLPAVAVTLVGFVAVRLVITELVRQHYMTAVTAIHPLGSNDTPAGAYWPIAQGVLPPNGQQADSGAFGIGIDGVSVNTIPTGCRTLRGNPGAMPSCLGAHGFRQFLTYQPANRYWAFQGIETGIFVALAAVLVAVAFAVISRGDA
jgi:hypothetical protein